MKLGTIAFPMPERGTQRLYAVAILVNVFGFGLIMTAMTLYATRVVHLSATMTGLSLTIASLIGLAAAVPIGDLADRRGPREVVRAIMLIQCLSAVCYLFARNFAEFTAVSAVDMLALNASLSADAALLRRIGGEDAAKFRASIQAILNLGISLGVVGCAVAIQINTPNAYRALLVVNALTFLAAWAISKRFPHYAPLPKPESGARWEVLSDKPFVVYTLFSAAMFLQYFVIIFLLPLWVVDHTSAPRWSVSLFVLINTTLIILFQVRVGQNVKTIRDGGRALRRAGVIFFFSCSIMGLAAGIPGWAALLLLAAAVSLHTVGELWHSSGAFAFEFGMPPGHAQGQYQGLSGIGTGLGQAAAPALLIGLVLVYGKAGFVALGVFFGLLAFTAPALARWCERTRPAVPEPAASRDTVVSE